MRAGRLGRAEPTPWVLGLAVFLIGVGVVMHLIVRSEVPGDDLWTLTFDSFRGGWRLAAWATGGLIAMAALLSLLQVLLPSGRGSRDTNRPELDGGGLVANLAEVRSRVEADCVGGDVSGAFDELLRGALTTNASDLHLSPAGRGLVATYRVDGLLHEVAVLPAELGKRLATRVKVLARLDPFVPRPQDGKIRHKVGERPREARVSCLPVDRGERIVLRLVRSDAVVPTLSQLGFDPGLETALEELLTKPEGLLLVSGPVGSGKTTTLYSALQHVAHSRIRTSNLVTLEDPIELQLPFATQTQINQALGMSFAQALRSALRQDPNVMMVGEIRDRETAEIAAQAGMTGHLILSTIHVESACASYARLQDMGIEPFISASTCIGALAQRLVRTLCTHCRRECEPDPLVAERLTRARGKPLGDIGCYEAVGCEYCEGQGYTGRAPIAELLIPSGAIRQAVHDGKPPAAIESLAVAEGLTTLLESGLARARVGETSWSEVLRVAG